MKYILKTGRFGSYFYDQHTRSELDLSQVLGLLNDRSNLKAKIEKLKELILLTDPVVGHVEVSDVQITQHREFLKCFPDELDLIERKAQVTQF